MERHIVLAHELIQLHILWISPPLLPVLGVVGCDGHIANASIEPHIHDFVIVSLKRNRCTPFQISRDTARLQAFSDPCICNVDAVVAPHTVDLALLVPLCRLLLQLVELKVDVFRLAHFGGGAIQLTTRIYQLQRI